MQRTNALQRAALIIAAAAMAGTTAMPMWAQTNPPSASSSTPWPYQGKVDESVFAPGGTGVTLYAAPDGSPKGDGSYDKPLDVKTAMGRIQTIMQSQDFGRSDVQARIEVPIWLRLVRSGNTFTAFTAPDVNGQPGEWKQAGEPRTLQIGSEYYAGLLVNNGPIWQDWGGEQEAEAQFDHITVNGAAVEDGRWSGKKIGTSGIDLRWSGTVEAKDGTVRVVGGGEDASRRGDFWYDSGTLASIPLSGDATVVARLKSLRASGSSKVGNASLVLREKAETHGQMIDLGVRAGLKEGEAPYQTRQLWRANRAAPGKPLRIVLKAGTYRHMGLGMIWGRDGVSRDFPLVIEGEKVNGQAGHVIFDGGSVEGWQPGTWVPFDLNGDGKIDAGDKGVYTHAGFNSSNFFASPWAPAEARNRSEALVLRAGGQAFHLDARTLENWKGENQKYTYQGFTKPTPDNIDTVLPPGSFAVNELGDSEADAARKIATPTGEKTFKEIFAENSHGFANTVFLRLPETLTAQQFTAPATEVTMVEQPVGFVSFDPHAGLQPWGIGNNGVLRNFQLRHLTSDRVFQLGHWADYVLPNRNWVFEDISLDGIKATVRFGHFRDFTIRNFTITNARGGESLHGLLSEGQIINMTLRNSGGFWNALRNIRLDNYVMENTRGGFRNDHVAENLLIENSRFVNGRGKAIILEGVVGPVLVRNTEFRNIDPGTGQEDNGILGIAQAHNIFFDHCLFENNKVSIFDFYERDRAHTPNRPGDDEMANNFDIGQWGGHNRNAEERTRPGGVRPVAWNRNLRVTNCTFRASGADTMFFRGHIWTVELRQLAYTSYLRDEVIAYNNAYFNPDNATPFEGPNQKQLSFVDWKKVSQRPDFEAGSSWGANTRPGSFMPPAFAAASPGKSSAGKQVASGKLLYEVETLPFATANLGKVELLTEAEASGGKLHKLHTTIYSEQLGDAVTYTLDVPQAGDYFVNVRYQRDMGGFRHLGYAQLSIDGRAQGSWWDQSGTRAFADMPLGRVHLTQGTHQFRFDPVWRNGYMSGSSDITIDSITLSTTLPLQAENKNAPAADGVSCQLFNGDFTQLPEFSKLTADDTGKLPSFDLSRFEDSRKFALRMTATLQVPTDGLYTFGGAFNDGGNLYIDDTLVIDANAIHGGEKDEPWEKLGFVSLAAGKHTIRVEYFEGQTAGRTLNLRWAGPGFEMQPLSAAALGGKEDPSALRPVGQNLLNGNTSAMQPFKKKMQGQKTLEEGGAWPQPWSVNLWNDEATGEAVLEEDPVSKRPAIVLRNLQGTPSIQFYTWNHADLPPGRYEFRFDYLTGGDAGGELFLNFKGGKEKMSVPVPASQSVWKRSSTVVEVQDTGVGISPQFRALGAGANNALYLRGISLRKLQD